MLLLILLKVQSLEFGSKDNMDPGPISWPKSDWSVNPIELSSNHAGETVDVKFTFNPSTTLASGIFLVNFPEGFVEKSRFVSGVSLISGQDITVIVPSVQLPDDKGVYGPVSIMTRVSEHGNIIDLNKIFSTILVSDKKRSAKANSLTISFENSDSAVVSSNQFLYFSFILSQDLWKHDLLLLTIDEKFFLQDEKCWTLVDFLRGSNSSTIECSFSSTENFLYIYGLSNDLRVSDVSTTGSVEVKLKVATFTMPDSAYAASDFNWNLSIFRYGTKTIVEEFTGKGPSIIHGEVLIKSWQPANYVPVSEIVSGMTTFMDLKFSLNHKVPRSGKIVVKFSGVDVKKTVWKSDESQSTSSGTTEYLMVSPFIGGVCSLTTSQVTCKDFESDIEPGSLSFTCLTRFSGSSAKVASILTMNENGDIIDRNLEGVTLVYAIAVKQQLLSHFSMVFASDSSGTLVSSTMTPVIGYLCFKTVSLPKSTVLTLYLPINAGAEKDFTLGLAQTTLKAKLLSSSSLLTSGYSFLTSSLVSLSDPSISSNKLSISLSGLSSSTTASDYIYIFLTSDTAAASPGLKLPRSSSTYATKYETILNFSVNGLIYKSSQVLTITPSSLGASASLLCTDKSLAGIPLTVSFLPTLAYALDSGSKLIVEVKFDSSYSNDLGSGISGAYPVFTLLEKVTFDLVQDSVARLQMTGLTTIFTTKTYSFTFPVGAASTDRVLEIRLFFVTSDRTDIEYEVMKNLVNIAATTTADSFSSITFNTVPNNGVTVADPVIGEKFSLQVSPFVSSGNYNSGYLGVILPAGFSLEDVEVFLTSDSGIVSTVLYSFSSTSAEFKLTSVFFTLTSSISVSSFTPAITVKTWKAPGYSLSAKVAVIMAPSSTGACLAQGEEEGVDVVPAALEEPTFSPDKVQARSASSLMADVELSFTISVKVPGGISLSLNEDWLVTDLTSYEVEGLSGEFQVSLSGNSYYISGFTEIKALTAVTFTLKNLSPPENTGKTGYFKSISTFQDKSFQIPIETWTDQTSDSCEILTGGVSSTSTIKEVSVFPNAAGAKDIYLYLKFTLPHSIPLTGQVQISSPIRFSEVGDQSENCWSSLKYQSCEIIEGFLFLTLAEKYLPGNDIEVLLDNAFDLPESGLTQDGFAILSSYNGVQIDQDSLFEYKDSQKLEVGPAPEATFTLGQLPLRVDPSTEGELALYSFSFSINCSVDIGDSILFSFPFEFDHLLGNAWQKFSWGDPDSFYLNCSSQALSTVTCKADHWNLVISSLSHSLPADTLIDLNISYIKNPEYTGRVFNNIGVYLYNSTHIKAVHSEYSGVTISAAASASRIKSIDSSKKKLQSSSTYTIEFFLDWTQLDQGDFLLFQFPDQYDLMLDNWESSKSLKCQASWKDQSPTSLNEDWEDWNSESLDCFINELNQVVWPVQQSKLFLQTDLVKATVEGLKNPEWGFTRNIEKYLGDPNVFGDYDVWVQKVEVLSYSGRYSRYISRSYTLLHSAFLGFYSGGASAVVNSFSAQTGEGFITLEPGRQSEDLVIAISSDYLKAKRLRFLPSNHGANEVKLEFSSDLNRFLMTRDLTSIHFRVSAPLSASNSVNYIEWVLEEVPLDGLVSPTYVSPVKTRVEVYQKSLESFVVGIINTVYLNIQSLPIKIFTSHAPTNEVIVALGLVDDSIQGVTFSPPALLFTQDINSLYFSILVDNETFTGKLETPVYIAFTVTESSRYSSISPVAFEVKDKPAFFASQISLLTFADLTQTGLSLRIKLNTAAVVFWVFGPSSSEFPDLENEDFPRLEDSRTDLFTEQVREFYSGLDNTPDNGESWEEFQRRLFKEFLGRIWTGVSYVDAGVTTDLVTFKWLWAGTSYSVKVLTDNKSGYLSNSTYTQETLEKNPAVEISLKFNEKVSEVFIPVVKNALALALGVISDLLVDGKSDGELFQWVLSADRASPLSPSTIITKLDKSILKANLKYAEIFQDFSIESKVLPQSAFEVPEWKTEPDLVLAGETFVTFNLSIQGKGKTCCQVVFNSSEDVGSSEQVYSGVNKLNSPVPSLCFNSLNDTVDEKTIEGLSDGNQYSLVCTLCSSYPQWPECSSNFSYLDFSSAAKILIKDEKSASIMISFSILLEVVLN